ncbi:MAG: hypothetical protein RRC34_06900 [Lentisphaeria bacterium]|nr:hypothetical protein [Lentisphaeria bacterium]
MGIDITNVKIGAFKTRSPRTETEDGWELEGREAVMTGDVVRLRDAKLTILLDEGKKAVARTSACRFDERERTLKGTEKVFLSHPAFDLTGIGCTVITDEQRVIIHDHVVMTIKNAAVNGRSLFERRPPEKPTTSPVSH